MTNPSAADPSVAHSSGPDLSGPDLLTAVRVAAYRDPGAPALSPDGVTWTSRAQLLALVERRSAELVAAGPVRAVPVAGEDPLDGVVELLAAQSLGAVPVLTAPGFDSGATDDLVLRAVAWADRDPDHATGAADPDHATGAGDPSDPGSLLTYGGRAVGGRLVLLTSGSSGDPRAVVRTTASWQTSLDPFTRVTGIRSDDVVWAPGPLSSTLTLFAVWHALATGLPVVAGGRWRGVVPAGVSVLHAVPTVLADLLDAGPGIAGPGSPADRPSHPPAGLRLAVLAGASGIRPLRHRAAARRLEVVEYYGAAELSFVAVDPDGSGLRAFPGVELQVRDGVVWARSPYLSEGYLAPSQGGPYRVDGAGWASVGDRAELGPDDTLTVTGRGDDGFSVGGQVVVAADVELALGGVDGVAELVCVAEPHARLGERVVAVVRPTPGIDPVPALREVARRQLPAAARPVRYVLMAELPRTAGGKVARAVLRERVTTAGRPGRR